MRKNHLSQSRSSPGPGPKGSGLPANGNESNSSSHYLRVAGCGSTVKVSITPTGITRTPQAANPASTYVPPLSGLFEKATAVDRDRFNVI